VCDKRALRLDIARFSGRFDRTRFTAGPECTFPYWRPVSPCPHDWCAVMSPRVAGGVLDERQGRLQTAAMDYVMHRWGVLPGPACDGVRYMKGHSAEPVAGLVPVLPGARTLRNAREVFSWWKLAPYGILARAGESFDVITAPTALAVEASRHPWFPLNGCPVAMAPDGTRFLVHTGARLRPELAAYGVELAAPGTVVALPPTRVLAGVVTWWIRPTDTKYQLGDPDAVQAALLDTRTRTATVSGGERHAR